MSYFRQITLGILSLLSGMTVTLRHLVQRPVTAPYPHRKPELSKAFRSVIALRRSEETHTHRCTACLACAKICPSACITVEGTRYEGVKGKRPVKFLVDYSLCSLCGLCIDSCVPEALTYSRVYDVAGYRRDQFVYDLLESFREDEARYIERQQAEIRTAAEGRALADGGVSTESPASEKKEP